MNGLALCAGYGGLELGIERVFPEARTVCYVEGEAFAVQHIVKKMEEGSLDVAPIWSNVKTFKGKPWRGKVDWLSGGFPCQPYSTAGKQMGEADPRDLWPDFVRIIGEVRPGFLFLENVPNVVKLRLNEIILDLDKLGYHVAWGNLSAAEVGAVHKRNRWFLFGVADSNNKRMGSCVGRSNCCIIEESGSRDIESGRSTKNVESQGHKESSNLQEIDPDSDFIGFNQDFTSLCLLERRRRQFDPSWKCQNVSNSNCKRSKRVGGFDGTTQKIESRKRHFDQSDKWAGGFDSWWQVEPSMGRLVDGASDWVDKLRLLGNGVVPQQAAYAFQILGERLACGIVEKRTPKD